MQYTVTVSKRELALIEAALLDLGDGYHDGMKDKEMAQRVYALRRRLLQLKPEESDVQPEKPRFDAGATG